LPSQLQTRLLLNTAQRPYWQVAFRVRHRDPTWLCWMFELGVAAFAGHLAPTVSLQSPDYVAAVHVCINTHRPTSVKDVANVAAALPTAQSGSPARVSGAGPLRSIASAVRVSG